MQNNALDKLKARETLTQSGQIELKLKLDKHIRNRKNIPELPNPMTIKIDIYQDGEDLSKLVSKELSTPKEMFKLVTAGIVIKDNHKLSQQV